MSTDGAVCTAAMAELAPDPMVLIDADVVGLWANQEAEALFGWERSAWVGRNLVPLVHPDDLATALLSIETVVDKAVGTAVEVRIRDAGGAYRWVEVRGRSALDVPGVRGIVLTIRDLTDRRRWEVAHGDTALLQTIVQHAPSIMLLLDTDGTVRSASRALTRVLGHGLERVEGRTLADLAPESNRCEVLEHLRSAAQQSAPYRFEARLLHAARSDTVPFEVCIANMHDDPVVHGMVASLHDLTDLDRVRSKLQYLATHDPLTGLANRALLLDHLDAALHVARRYQHDVALFYVDLDGFKAVNDRLGHEAGDELLRQIAESLLVSARKSDVVARFGGDEFVLLAPHTGTVAAHRLAQRIETAIVGSHALALGTVVIGASVGFAVSRHGIDSADELLRSADDAMYAVKGQRRPNRLPVT